MDEVLGEVIKYSIAPAVGLLTLLATNRHNRAQANAERAHQQARAQGEAADARTERRYDERRTAYAGFIDVVTGMRETALKREWEGRPTPSDYLDPPDLAGYMEPLDKAHNAVLLIGTKETRDASEKLHKATWDYVWTWTSEDYRHLDQALIDFRAAARRDLGIEGGAPDTPGTKPTKPPKTSS